MGGGRRRPMQQCRRREETHCSQRRRAEGGPVTDHQPLLDLSLTVCVQVSVSLNQSGRCHGVAPSARRSSTARMMKLVRMRGEKGGGLVDELTMMLITGEKSRMNGLHGRFWSRGRFGGKG